jgi:DNA polymerase-3 subunit alpha
MPAVGISDNNNMFGALEFSEQIAKVGVQPILGCYIKIKTPKEYLHENIEDNDLYFYLNIFSKNNEGYENLLKCVSNAYTFNKGNAYVTVDDLIKFKDGLIILSGGNNSILAHSTDHMITKQLLRLTGNQHCQIFEFQYRSCH